MKKVLNAIVWTLLCAMMLGLFPAYAQEDITVMVDGKAVAFTDQKPVMVEDRVLVPLHGVFNALGAVVEYIEETESVFASKRSSYITLEIGSNELYVNGTAVTLDVPSQLIQDRTMVPLRAVAEAFGADVTWDDGTNTVYITSKQGAHHITDCYLDKEYTAADGTVLLTVRYAYPLIQNDAQAEVIEQLNSKFAADAQSAVEAAAKELLASAQEEYEGLYDASNAFMPYYYSRSFDIGIDTAATLSIVESVTTNTHGAHPNTDVAAVTYDLNTGEELALTDFFDGTEAEIEAMVVQTFHTVISEEPEMYFEDAAEQLNELVKDVVWYPAEDGFVFLFNRYMIAPYAAGAPSVTLVYDSGSEAFQDSFLEQLK